MNLKNYIKAHRAWSKKTLGPGNRYLGVLDHISKEVEELRQCEGKDASEWADVIILAIDGAWRSGFTSAQLCAALERKQKKNMARTWPDWRGRPVDKAIEHVR